ncbi:MAG: FAD-dependent oxidoreductase [Pseudomonadota bacterium]
MSGPSPHIAVVGAGMAGLTAARVLEDAGYVVAVYEKSRGVGGRLATRRVRDAGPAHGLQFDHGAPAIVAREASFASFLQSLREKDAAAAWPAFNTDVVDAAALVGVPRMNTLLAPAAAGLDIRFQTRVRTIIRDGSRWRLDLDAPALERPHATPSVDAVIVTAPAPQTADILLLAEPDLAAAARAARMTPCWTLMIAIAGATKDAPSPRTIPVEGPIEMIVFESAKPGRAPAPLRVVAHARADWSADNLERDRDDVAAELTPFVLAAIGEDGAPVLYASAHRWRYARVARPVGAPFLSSDDGTALAAGDWLLGAEAEDAFKSGDAAAKALMERLSLKPR